MKRRFELFRRNAQLGLRAGLKKIRSFFRRLSPRGYLVIFGGTAVIIAAVVLIAVLSGRGRSRAAAASLDVSSQPVGEGGIILIEVTPSPSPSPTPEPTPTPDPTLRKGSEGPEVQALQERLMELGYLELDESTEYFGSATRAAVQLFQRQVAFNTGESIAMDGVAGLQTLGLIYADDAPKYVVKEGMEGNDIEDMQRQLVDLGYMSAITGYYGEKTISAIKSFQSENGLSSDGLAGEMTVEMLYSPEAKLSPTKRAAERSRANVATMIEVAKKALGSPYVRGAQGPSKFDCSGLVYYCLKQAGSNRARYNAAGYSRVSDWEKIDNINNLKKGDLIFFYDDGFTKVGHVGIVVSSGGVMIDASSSNGKVVRRSFLTTYWKKHFVCGRRPW